jgi:hypothetical protein
MESMASVGQIETETQVLALLGLRLVYTQPVFSTMQRVMAGNVVHELLHPVEPNHGERFMKLMNSHLPRWAATQKRLNAAPLAWLVW